MYEQILHDGRGSISPAMLYTGPLLDAAVTLCSNSQLGRLTNYPRYQTIPRCSRRPAGQLSPDQDSFHSLPKPGRLDCPPPAIFTDPPTTTRHRIRRSWSCFSFVTGPRIRLRYHFVQLKLVSKSRPRGLRGRLAHVWCELEGMKRLPAHPLTSG